MNKEEFLQLFELNEIYEQYKQRKGFGFGFFDNLTGSETFVLFNFNENKELRCLRDQSASNSAEESMKAKVTVVLALVLALFCSTSAQAARVLKFGHIAPTKIENKDFPMHKAALAFAAPVSTAMGSRCAMDH